MFLSTRLSLATYEISSISARVVPETAVWKTCTPYFEKRNIHFYVNKCGFQIDQFWCENFQPDHHLNDEGDEGPDEMFRFIKIMKK